MTRKEAKILGLKRYENGKPCKYGHIFARCTDSGSCLKCRSLYKKNNRAKMNRYQKNYRDINRESYREKDRTYKREYYKKNPEKYIHWKLKYSEKRKIRAKEYYSKPHIRQRIRKYVKNKRKEDPNFAIAHRMRNRINQSIKFKKSGRKWEDIVGYSINDLITHLEKQFQKGMTWGNRNKWHIDHIIPVCNFDLTNDEGIRTCWALSNLRPLWAEENQEKSYNVRHLL
jgi:hypothetical protein